MTRARDVANLIGSGNYSSTTFTATAGQTAFSISHTQGFVQVFMNGLLLDETADYTSNGSAITLTSGAAAGDEIEVVKYNTFSVGDAIAKSGGTFTGAVTASNGLTVDDDGATPLTVDRATSDGQIVALQKDGSTIGSIGVVGSNNVYLHGDNVGIGIGDDNLYATNSAGASSDAALDIGDSTVRFRDTYLSGGIYLGGTGAANKLADYEEGTWTPIMGNQSTTMASIQNASYIKIGKLVTISVDVTCPIYTGIQNNYMYGLPFAGAHASSGNGGGAIGYTVTPNVVPGVHVTSNTSILYFMKLGTGTAGESCNISGMRLIFGLTYETT